VTERVPSSASGSAKRTSASPSSARARPRIRPFITSARQGAVLVDENGELLVADEGLVVVRDGQRLRGQPGTQLQAGIAVPVEDLELGEGPRRCRRPGIARAAGVDELVVHPELGEEEGRPHLVERRLHLVHRRRVGVEGVEVRPEGVEEALGQLVVVAAVARPGVPTTPPRRLPAGAAVPRRRTRRCSRGSRRSRRRNQPLRQLTLSTTGSRPPFSSSRTSSPVSSGCSQPVAGSPALRSCPWSRWLTRKTPSSIGRHHPAVDPGGMPAS